MMLLRSTSSSKRSSSCSNKLFSYREHKKKKAALMHNISVLENDLAAAKSEFAKMKMERDRAMQNVTMAELRLREMHEDHEQLMVTLQEFRNKKNKECNALQLQCNTLLAKLSSTENELFGTRYFLESNLYLRTQQTL